VEPRARGILVAAILLAVAGYAAAQGRSDAPGGSSAAPAEARLALVIGNGAYREAPLRNPVRDARAMAQALRDVGFTVIAHENSTKRALETAVLEFGRRLTGGGVGVFYYAGHGLQVRGRNFLVPVDAEIDFEAAARVQAVDVDLVLEQMAEARNRVNVVILDACRNNPFERRLRGAASRGLAPIDAARGTLIAYATAPGAVAADGEGANGLYTEELLKALRVPGLKIEEVFKRVRVSVTERSQGTQTPWESSSLTGDLVVNVSVNVQVQAPPPAPVVAAPPPGPTAAVPSGPRKGTPEGRFDGTWMGFARDTKGVKGCADSAEMHVTITGPVLRGTLRQPSGEVSSFSAEVEADGTVATAGLSGRFTDGEFRGRWERRGSRAACVFDVSLKRQP
jgi:Caspase domain